MLSSLQGTRSESILLVEPIRCDDEIRFFAAQQFGAIPVTFDGVAKLGLATFPAGSVMDVYDMATTWLLDKIGWCANIMMGIEAIWFLAARGNSGVPVKLVLLGVAISGIGSLIGTGGIITWIMNYISVAAPVVA